MRYTHSSDQLSFPHKSVCSPFSGVPSHIVPPSAPSSFQTHPACACAHGSTAFAHFLAESAPAPAPAPERPTVQLGQAHVSADRCRAVSLSHTLSCTFQRSRLPHPHPCLGALQRRRAAGALPHARAVRRRRRRRSRAFLGSLGPLRAYKRYAALMNILRINKTTSRRSIHQSAYIYCPPFSAPSRVTGCPKDRPQAHTADVLYSFFNC